MTVVIAAQHKGRVIMAADSMTTGGWERIYADRTKLWVAGQYLIGSSGSVRASQVIRHHTDWPKFRPDEDTDVEAFLVRRVVPAIRAAVDGQGVVTVRDGCDDFNASLLIAWGHHVAEIDGRGCALVRKSGAVAIGSGYAEALGALGDRRNRKAVVEAASRATQLNIGCGGSVVYGDTKSLTIGEAAQ